MPTELSSDVKFGPDNVLFIDIVGYSKLLIGRRAFLFAFLRQRPAQGNKFANRRSIWDKERHQSVSQFRDPGLRL